MTVTAVLTTIVSTGPLDSHNPHGKNSSPQNPQARN